MRNKIRTHIDKAVEAFNVIVEVLGEDFMKAAKSDQFVGIREEIIGYNRLF